MHQKIELAAHRAAFDQQIARGADMMNGIVRFIIGPGDQRFTDGERFVISARTFKQLTGLQEGLAIKTTEALTVITAVIVVAALFWFLNKTRTGKSMPSSIREGSSRPVCRSVA